METRLLYVATNELPITHVLPIFHVGANEVTAPVAELAIRDLSQSLTGFGGDKLKRQFARRLFDLFHDAYDRRPSWL